MKTCAKAGGCVSISCVLFCRAWNSYSSWSLLLYSQVIMTHMNLYLAWFMKWFMVVCTFSYSYSQDSWQLRDSYSWVHGFFMNFIHGFMVQFIGPRNSYSWTLLSMPWIIHRFHEYIHSSHPRGPWWKENKIEFFWLAVLFCSYLKNGFVDVMYYSYPAVYNDGRKKQFAFYRLKFDFTIYLPV